jgi:hypothetical protein
MFLRRLKTFAKKKQRSPSGVEQTKIPREFRINRMENVSPRSFILRIILHADSKRFEPLLNQYWKFTQVDDEAPTLTSHASRRS